MSNGERSAACRNCGRLREESALDATRWCESCRAVVIHRASLWGRALGLLIASLLGAWIFLAIDPEIIPVVVWLVLIAATYVFVSKLVRRIAFEIIRGRGVPPAEH